MSLGERVEPPKRRKEDHYRDDEDDQTSFSVSATVT
jgi:hypothetical protein